MSVSDVQCEIGFGANTLVQQADAVRMLKHALHDVGARYFLPATSMRAWRNRAYTTLAVSSNTPKPSIR
jgi:glutamine synthetase